MKLSPAEHVQLLHILKLAHSLEANWGDGLRRLTDTQSGAELIASIANCAEAESESLRRLSSSCKHLSGEMPLRHFYAFLVPFERLAQHSVRDDEFIVHELDRTEQVQEPLPLKFIVENMRSAFNVGALFRTGECLGVEEILLCGYTPDPNDGKVIRTAMGTESLVPWRRVDRATRACRELQQAGIKVVALETAATATPLHDFQFSWPMALLVGNERFGIESETLRMVDAICSIPMRGQKNSLNAGVALGAVGFEWLRQFNLRASL